MGPQPMSAPRGSRAVELQDIEAGVGIGEVHDALGVDETVARLNDLRPVRARIEHALGIGRHEIADLARLEWICDVVSAHAGIVQRRENVSRALEGAGPTLPEIMRAEIAALLAIVRLARGRHRGDAHRIRRDPDIENPY